MIEVKGVGVLGDMDRLIVLIEFQNIRDEVEVLANSGKVGEVPLLAGRLARVARIIEGVTE